MSGQITQHGVVVGVDGSRPSEVALRWATHEATMRNVPLTLVYVAAVPPIGSVPIAWPAAPIPDEVLARREEYARNILRDAVTVVKASAHGGAQPEVREHVVTGSPVPVLADFSKEAKLVVVGCQGHSALRSGLLGSVSGGLIHHAHCPVAVIHADAAPSLAPSKLPVVVGVDGSQLSELAIELAFDEASWRGVDLVALHVWSDVDMHSAFGAEWSDLESAANETLAQSLAGWHERYPDVSVHRVVEFENPARHLLELSEQSQLVVVGSRGRGGFVGMLLGSVSSAVAHAARVPVIVARRG